MIIGIDGNEANVNTRVGVGWYVHSLLQEFHKLSSSKYQFRIFLKEPPLNDLPKQKANFVYQIVPKKTIWSQIDLPLALFFRGRDLDVFLSPAHYSPRFCLCPTMVVVHDLSYFYYPQDFLKKDLYQLVNWTGYSVKKAKQVIAVSLSTKKDIIANYSLNESKIAVVHNGFTSPTIKPIKPAISINKPYFLYLGTLQPRKNIENLILGFEQLLINHPEQTLYLVGKKGWLYQEIYDLVKQRKLVNKVIFTDYVSEPEKWFLLKEATALIMPGWYEGFGLPILEALAVGTPVICSQSGALPEIAESAAVYFDPAKPEELAQMMSQIIDNSKLKAELVKLGKQRLKQFAWSRTASEILKIIAA